jgi:PIN domain nuclease of toxin-antitoxin system
MRNWTRAKGAFVDLLIDTQILVWLLSGDRRMSPVVLEQMSLPSTQLFVSAVTAWEYTELQQRGRLPVRQTIDEHQALFGFELLAFPNDAWRIIATMPHIHRDPIDRMLVAHAISAGLTLVSADAQVRQYPVKCLW